MSALVGDLLGGARALFNDNASDHFSKDRLSSQIFDGSQTRFRTLNRNILDTGLGAPADPVILLNGVITAPSTFDFATGIFVLASPPGINISVEAEYYFQLITTADYIEFAKQASRFLGTEPTFTMDADPIGFDPLLAEAAQLYMAGLAAKKMSNLAGWYYSANAGNKSFDKNKIADNFRSMAKEFQDEAILKRDDRYKRWGQRNAPSYGYTNMPAFNRPIPPRR